MNHKPLDDEWQPSPTQIDAWCGDGKTAGGVPAFRVPLWRRSASEDLRRARKIIMFGNAETPEPGSCGGEGVPRRAREDVEARIAAAVRRELDRNMEVGDGYLFEKVSRGITDGVIRALVKAGVSI